MSGQGNTWCGRGTIHGRRKGVRGGKRGWTREVFWCFRDDGDGDVDGGGVNELRRAE